MLDVGANEGQFGRWLRNHGYGGRIISFEPLSAAYQMLLAESAGDGLWEARQFAIGDAGGSAVIRCRPTRRSVHS